MKKGIFWCKDMNENPPRLITVSVECSFSGECEGNVNYSSKSGKNFNHKKEWSKLDKNVTEGYPYNYYPRGRVEIKNGKVTIFLNPDINTDEVLDVILTEFELKDDRRKIIKVKSDGSNHYQYLMHRDEVSKKQFRFENAEKRVKEFCMDAIARKYGKTIPKAARHRLDEELLKISECDGWSQYLLAAKLAEKNRKMGYVHNVRGCAGGSFVAYLLGITETNPLPAMSGYEDGNDIPYEFFMGSSTAKNPSFDLNFANEIQSNRLDFCKEILGENQVFYGGVFSDTVGENYLKIVKHPGKLVIVPKDCMVDCFVDKKKGIIYDERRRFDSINVLEHDMFSRLKKIQDYIGVNVHELHVGNDIVEEIAKWKPEAFEGLTMKELGQNEIFRIVKPKNFSELVKVYGLSHGRGTWNENGEELFRDGIPLDDIIAHREDVMLKLLQFGLSREESYQIAEYVRMGKVFRLGFQEEQIARLKEVNVPDWYIESMQKIKYLFPKSHAVEYVRNFLREAWIKEHYPDEFKKVIEV